MKKFIQNISVFIVILIIPFIIWISYYGFPPPSFSSSLSFNAKSQFTKENDFINPLDVLTIGSSMSLNNINSNSIIRNISKKYLNFSSWGQNIEEDYKLIQIFEKHLKPNIIIISSNVMDFRSLLKQINYNMLETYLFEGENMPFPPKLGKVYFQDSRNFSKYKENVNIYQCLKFDSYGGVNFNSEGFKITSERWNGNKITKTDASQYLFLDSIARFCNKKDIRFVFVQSPFREGWMSKIEDTEKEIINAHIAKVQSILTKHKCQFVNATQEIWADCLFVDYSHLNDSGSRKYTNLLIKEIELGP